jgi:hypothetical protein
MRVRSSASSSLARRTDARASLNSCRMYVSSCSTRIPSPILSLNLTVTHDIGPVGPPP